MLKSHSTDPVEMDEVIHRREWKTDSTGLLRSGKRWDPKHRREWPWRTRKMGTDAGQACSFGSWRLRIFLSQLSEVIVLARR